MLKAASIVVIISTSNPEKTPNVSLPVSYESLKECQNQMDQLKKNINAIETFDNSNRVLKLYNRSINQESIIYWYCKTEDIK